MHVNSSGISLVSHYLLRLSVKAPFTLSICVKCACPFAGTRSLSSTARTVIRAKLSSAFLLLQPITVSFPTAHSGPRRFSLREKRTRNFLWVFFSTRRSSFIEEFLQLQEGARFVCVRSFILPIPPCATSLLI